MAIFDLFSKRQKKLRGEVPDVYSYDSIPKELRTQVILIWRDVNRMGRVYEPLVKALCREYGIFVLCTVTSQYSRDYQGELAKFFYETESTEQALDVIELIFQALQNRFGLDSLVTELNYRFKEHGVGYQFEGGQIIRVDSQLIHQEAVKPALSLLADPDYRSEERRVGKEC